MSEAEDHQFDLKIQIDDGLPLHNHRNKITRWHQVLSLIKSARLTIEAEFAYAFDGKEGIKACLLEEPDLVVADPVMPNMNGIQVLTDLECGFESTTRRYQSRTRRRGWSNGHADS